MEKYASTLHLKNKCQAIKKKYSDKLMKLGGYHRLWVVLSFLYLAVVVTFLIFIWPTAENIPNEKKFLDALPLDARKIIVSKQRDEAPMAQVSAEMLDGNYQEMSYPHNWTKDQVAAAIYKHISQAQPKVNKMVSRIREVTDPALLAKLAKLNAELKARGLREVTDPALLKALNTRDVINLLEENQPVLVRMPNNYVIAFDKNAPKKQMEKVCALYWTQIEKECLHEKLYTLFLGLFFWLIPCLIIYILGFSIHWVIQGFKNPSCFRS